MVPHARNDAWRSASVQCGLRMVARMAAGKPPAPNCTGEELFLQLALEDVQDLDECEPDNDLWDFYGLDQLPESKADSDWALLTGCLLQVRGGVCAGLQGCVCVGGRAHKRSACRALRARHAGMVGGPQRARLLPAECPPGCTHPGAHVHALFALAPRPCRRRTWTWRN